MTTVICVENLSKSYRLGQIGSSTLSEDINRWWARVRGQPDPYLKIGQVEHDNRRGEYLWALREINFSVQQGEVLGIIGRNGAGKSTLLKILSRVTAPTSGQIKVKGRIASLLEVGTGFHPELTGRENVFLNSAILGMSKTEVQCKFDEIVDFAEIEKFIDTPVKRYSSGMYVRLAFAVAAHLEPEILVVDEVLAVGDIAFQRKCLGKMGEVAQQGRTVLFVSHNMPAVTTLCTRAILLFNGTILSSGTTENIISQYFQLNRDAGIQSHGIDTKNRRGSGKMRITDWTLVDKVLGEGKQVGCNHHCEIRLTYNSKEATRLQNVSIAIVIKDSFDRPILTGATHFLNQDFQELPPQGTIACNFPSLPLLPDQYKLYVWCSVNGEEADVIEHAGDIDILPDDVYGTGRIPRKKHGYIAISHSWKLL